jgi:hypothetical protein
MMPINKSDIDDIFNIPIDGSHLDDATDSSEPSFSKMKSKKNASSFSEEALRAAETLAKSAPHAHIPATQAMPEELVQQNSKTVPTKSAVVVEKAKVSKSKTDSQEHPHDEEAVDNSLSVCQSIPIDGTWSLSHPDARFKDFYVAKANALNSWLLPGGRLKFSELKQELRECRIDLSDVVIGDIRNLFEKMREVQSLKDRVVYIINCCNEQYYPWKRAIDMYTGYLARIQYLKPVQRQAGLVAEHMGDMERYISELEALHSIAEHISRNLESVYELLSRQVTMSMPQTREVETLEKRASKAELSKADGSAGVSFLDQMDSVPQSLTPSRARGASFKNAKTGTIDWE